MKNKIEDLRNHLFETIEMLKDKLPRQPNGLPEFLGIAVDGVAPHKLGAGYQLQVFDSDIRPVAVAKHDCMAVRYRPVVLLP